MLSIQALREKRAAKAREISELVNKQDIAWTADMQTAYDAGMKEVEALDAQISRINESNRLLAADVIENVVLDSLDRNARDTQSAGRALFAKWARGGVEALTSEEAAQIRNTMSVGTGSQGGYTVATEVASSVLDALKAYGGMRSVANVIRTAQGNPMSYPTSDGTSETGELVAENGSASAADPTFNTVGLGTYKYSSKIIAVPFELLADSNTDVEAFVRTRMVTRIGRITNTHFTVGSGSGQPNGVVTAAATGKTGLAGQTTTVIFDDLIDLIHSVDPAYRGLGNCRFMMNDSTLRAIKKIKDSTGRPIFTPSYEAGGTAGSPDMILGYPVQINQDVAAMAANAKSILFGDFSFYTIRDVMDVSMFRFTDSVYTSKGQVGFLAWARAGGNFVDVGGSVKAYANSAT
jgi:HK97 family phage major capsid protein